MNKNFKDVKQIMLKNNINKLVLTCAKGFGCCISLSRDLRTRFHFRSNELVIRSKQLEIELMELDLKIVQLNEFIPLILTNPEITKCKRTYHCGLFIDLNADYFAFGIGGTDRELDYFFSHTNNYDLFYKTDRKC